MGEDYNYFFTDRSQSAQSKIRDKLIKIKLIKLKQLFSLKIINGIETIIKKKDKQERLFGVMLVFIILPTIYFEKIL